MQELMRVMITAVFALLLNTPAAQSATYSFTYESFDFPATFTFVVDPSGEIVDISGLVKLGYGPMTEYPVLSIVANSAYPGSSTTADGLFQFNNAFYAAGPYLDLLGVAFTTENSTGFWHLFFDTHNEIYKLFASANGHVFQESEGFLTPTPLPGALVLFLTGICGLGFLSRRRRWKMDRLMPA
jgi:hypothetical protein